MNKNYWLVKLFISGFEASVIMYGTEESLRAYIQSNFNGPMSYLVISEEVAQLLMNMSSKVYVCPNFEEVKHVETTEDETEVVAGIS